METETAKAQPGDIRLDPKDFMTGEQPLTGDERLLLNRGYALFEAFRTGLKDAHAEMRDARLARKLKQEARSDTSPTMMTLNSCIDNVIADQIDNTPEAVMIPEKPQNVDTADEMTDLVGFVLYKAGWPGVYERVMEDAAVTGTGIVEVFWDNDAMNGDGFVNVGVWHPEDFYPDPMYEDIQDGRACFKATRTTVAWVNEHYPEAKGWVHADNVRQNEEINPYLVTPIDDSEVTLLEFWYKRYDARKRRYRVHMAMMAGGALLYSTETGFGCEKKDEYAQGVFAHGQYPFAMYRYRNTFREPFGTGLYRDFRTTQEAIDRYSKYMDDNARESSVQRHFIRRGSGVNADEVADLSRTVIEWDGSDIREVLQTVQAAPINAQVYTMLNHMTESMKQDSGQNPFTRGETAGGVTADSAIQRILSQGSKITRWHAEVFKDAFRGMVEQIMWVLSDYLEPGRKIHIAGGSHSSRTMKDRDVELMPPAKTGDELPPPAYSVRVQAQRINPAYKEAFNEQLMRAYEISAQTGNPIPASVLFETMMGIPDKGYIVNLLRNAETQAQRMAQLQQQNEQLSAKLAEKEQLVSGWRERFHGTQGGAAAINQTKQPTMQTEASM